jgi:hypothetical protein
MEGIPAYYEPFLHIDTVLLNVTIIFYYFFFLTERFHS